MLPSLGRINTPNQAAHARQCQLLALLYPLEINLDEAVPYRGMSDLYSHLIDRGMVWEFRDLVQAHLRGVAPSEVFDSIMQNFPDRHRMKLDSGSPHFSQGRWLLELWSTIPEDVSTLFAMLDVFTALALKWRELRPANQSREGIAKCMDLADECGSALGALDDAYLMTRPCLRWIMAKQMIKDNIELLFYDQAASPGHGTSSASSGFRFSRGTFPNGYLPVYVPIDGHIPHWKPRRAPHGEDFRSVAHMVLRAAEVLGDLDLQTACLQELLYRGLQSPESVIPTLHRIWTSSGNKWKLPWLNLFRALMAHTPSAREELHRDLLLEMGTGDRYHTLYRLNILEALTQDRERQMTYRQMKEAVQDNYWQDNAFDHDQFGGSHDSKMGHIRRKKTSAREPSTLPLQRRPVAPLPSPAPPPLPRSSHSRYPGLDTLDPSSTPALLPDWPHTEQRREKMAKIQAMIKEIENDLRQEASALPIVRAKFEIERSRSGRERTPDAEGVPGEHTGQNDPVPLEPEGGLAADPKPNVLQRRATVEDYLGTSESGDKSDDTEDRGVRGPERARYV